MTLERGLERQLCAILRAFRRKHAGDVFLTRSRGRLNLTTQGADTDRVGHYEGNMRAVAETIRRDVAAAIRERMKCF